MPNNAPIIYPRLWSNHGQFPGIQREAVGDGSNTFVGQQFVRVATGALVAYAADDVNVYGLTIDGSHAATDEAYLTPFGENHNPIDPRNARFIANISDASGTVGSGSTTHANITLGALYSGVYLSSPTTAFAIDASDSGTSTKHIFKPVAYYNTSIAPDGDASTDYNGRVIFEVIQSGCQ